MAAECCCCIDFELEENQTTLTLDVADDALVWGSDEYVKVVTSDADEYDGPYEVTPSAREQTLGTMSKLMREDVTVHKVPYFETGNESGGLTVSILS